MFGLGGAELLVVILLAVLLIGPKDLPRVAHQLGRWFGQFKGAADELKNTLEREVSLHEKDEAPESRGPGAA
jgi:Sec-independent protein secretion pathway components